MRDHNKAFARAAVDHFDCPGPVYEFGSYQVEGQLDYADLRSMFAGKTYFGCDMRPGPGVDRVEDVSAISVPDQSAGTILCIETFEHVFEVRRAFDEVFRVLKPGGVFILTSPFHFRIHAYPDDYWRISPSCLRRLLEPYAGRVVGFQGHSKTPHTVMSFAIKGQAPHDFPARADRMIAAYQHWLGEQESMSTLSSKLKTSVTGIFRSRSERQQINAYHRAEFVVDQATTARRLGLAG
jgi:SAM-dependent methyltransferase